MAIPSSDRFKIVYGGEGPGAPHWPATRGGAVTPSDSTDLTNASRGLWVGGAGNITVTMLEGGDVTLTGVPAGTWLPLRVTRVKATGTTATNIASFD